MTLLLAPLEHYSNTLLSALSAQRSWKHSYGRRITDLDNRKSAASLQTLDPPGAAFRYFPPFQLQNMEPSSKDGCIRSFKKGHSDFSFFYKRKKGRDVISTSLWYYWNRVRIKEFTAYLRIQNSPLDYLTIPGTGSCVVEQKRMQKSCSQEREQVLTWLSLIRALIWSRKALWNVSNPKTSFLYYW